jgi:hypothetical protein
MQPDVSTLTAHDWLRTVDAVAAAFHRAHAPPADAAAAPALHDAALAQRVADAAAQATALRQRRQAIVDAAQRLLASRSAPCAALQRVMKLSVARTYESLRDRSATLLARAADHSSSADDAIALCDALLRAARALEPIAARAPLLAALVARRAAAAVDARRVHHVDACRRLLLAAGWPEALGDDKALLSQLQLHMQALDRLQALQQSLTPRTVRWALAALLEPMRVRFRFHFSGARPTNRNDKPEWIYAHVRSLLRDSAPVIARLRAVDSQLWIAALVQMASERVARTLVELPASSADDAGALLRHVVAETLAFEAELQRIHSYPKIVVAFDDDGDDGGSERDDAAAWPLPSDAFVDEAPPSYAGAMQWLALEYDDIAAVWNGAINNVAASLRDAPAVLLQCLAPSATRGTQLSSRGRRASLLRETLVRGAGLARSTLQAIGFARCDAGDVHGAAVALDSAERLAVALEDAAATPLVMTTAPDVLADELAALRAMRQALLASLVQQFLLTPLAQTLAPLVRAPRARAGGAANEVSAHVAVALCDLQRDLERVRDACDSSGTTMRTVVLELCGAIDAHVFETLWTAQPTMAQAAAAQLSTDLAALVRLLDSFTDPLPARRFLRKAHDVAVLFALKRAEREHLRDVIARADEAVVLSECRAIGVHTLSADLPRLLVVLKLVKA